VSEAQSTPRRDGGDCISREPPATDRSYDAIVIGSGFGGTMVAHRLVRRGLSVLMLERGDWVERGQHNWEPEASLELTPFYSMESPYDVVRGGYGPVIGGYYCVGGPSVFYGGVAFRFREEDFRPSAAISNGSGARWPIGYDAMEEHYAEAEQLLGVAGDDEGDPTRPRRSSAYPQRPAPLSKTSERIATAARSLGLSPFRLPLAINYTATAVREACQACRTCDTFACAVSAKNDLATGVIPDLCAQGMALASGTVANRLVEESGRIVAVRCYDRIRREEVTYRAELFVLAAGALASPHLLLASGLERLNPAGHTVGHYLMRHCNGMVFGVFPDRPDPETTFHKQIAINDYYFGDGARLFSPGKLGGMQQVMTPPVSLVRSHLPWGLRTILTPTVEHLTGMLVMAEDQPQYENKVTLDRHVVDEVGLPRLRIAHRYSVRDLWARRTLVVRAKRVLRRAGALLFHTHHIKTFSHAIGTVRMGGSAETSALDERGCFRGVENLYVTDGSALPTSAGVNPSLTIAANALRIGERIAE